jgi:hypothetical protein
MKGLRKLRYSVLLLASVTLAIVSGCSGPTFFPAGKSMSQFDIKLIDIGFGHNTDLFSPDILSIPGDKLLFRVDITPKDVFTGEPFETIKLGNKDIGYQTLVLSTPAVWLVLLSKDGYFFSSEGPLRWTPEELQLPDASERDYYKIQSMRERRVKHVTLSAPSSDKAVVALLKDSNELASELWKGQWRELIKGDWLLGEDLPKEFDEEYIRGKFEALFNRHFRLVIVDSDGLQKLKYPDRQTKLIATWSGKGRFTTPTFTVTYDRLKTSWVGNPPGQFEYNLYDVEGKYMGGTRTGAEPDKKHESGQPVQPGKSYYIEIITPQEMQWTFWLEETNLPP